MSVLQHKTALAEIDARHGVRGLTLVKLVEAIGGVGVGAVRIVEGETGGPVKLDVLLIEPGWGNTRDNNYYPAPMLKEYAPIFKGAKMYATDHREHEKSVLTEVAQILSCPVGFTPSGGVVARVGVFDERFAASVRNRAALDALDSLAVSILASGTSSPFAESARKGRRIDAITEVKSVDFVTRAGAGGRALRLAEGAWDARGASLNAALDAIDERYGLK